VRRNFFWFFIASLGKGILGRKNCIALFDLFSADCVLVSAIIDTFLRIAAHHC